MIDESQIEFVVAVAQQYGDRAIAVSELRRRMPGFHFTHCLDDDVAGVRPVREALGFKLYLVDGRNHCLGFTGDPAAATGFVLAEVDDP